MAIPSVTYTFTNSTVADATEVNTNFSDLINALTDGTSDHSISTLTLAGALTANGNVTLGNASGDTMTVNATPTFVNATTFSSTTTFNGAPTFNAAVTVGAYDFTVNTDTFFVDASEDSVGIGTTSPSGSFHINTDPTGDCDVHFECAGGSDVNLIFSETDPTNPLFSIQYAGSAGSNPNNLFKIRSNSNGASGIDTDVITITQSGNVGIGTTSPGAILDVQDSNTAGIIARFGDSGSNTRFTINSGGQVYSGTGANITYQFRTAPGSVTGASYCMSASSSCMPTGVTTGSLQTVQWHTTTGVFVRNTSSLKYKENVNDINVGLDLITQLRPVKYNRKGNPDTEYGLIAEEVHQVAPELVTYLEEEIDGLKEFEFKAIFVKAIQELKAEIDSLKARLDALESI